LDGKAKPAFEEFTKYSNKKDPLPGRGTLHSPTHHSQKFFQLSPKRKSEEEIGENDGGGENVVFPSEC